MQGIKGIANLKLIIAILSILFIFSFPNIFAYFSTPDNKVFTGQAYWFDPWDVNVYVSAINWSQKYKTNFQNAYTITPHEPLVLYPFYTFAGILFPNSNPFLLYHLLIVIFGAAMLLVFYRSIRVFSKAEPIYTLFLIVFGGGFGWFFYPRAYLPDIAITPFTFTSTFQRPHELLAVGLYALALTYFFLAIKHSSTKFILLSAMAALAVLPFYPSQLLSYYLIIGVFTIYQLATKKTAWIRYIILPVVLTLPFGIFYAYLINTNNGFNWTITQQLPTPNLIAVLMGYGITIPLIAYNLKNTLKKETSVFLLIWLVASIALAYLPLGFARYYLRGLFFPAVILAVDAFNEFLKNRNRYPKVLKIAFPLFLTLTSISILLLRIALATDNNAWYYLSKDDQQILTFLDKETSPGSGVLAPYPFSNHVPVHTLNRVYVGHHLQTPNSQEKFTLMEKFYRQEFSEQEAIAFLKDNNISHIVWPKEIEVANYNFLDKKFESATAFVFTTKTSN